MAAGNDDIGDAVAQALAAADAAAGASAHYAVKRPPQPWYRRLLANTTVVVILVGLAAGFLAYSVWVNQQAITRTNAQAQAAKAQAKAAASGQLAALQLICTLERDIRENSTKLTRKDRASLMEYDKELHCTASLKKPHAPIVLTPPAHAVKPGGGQGGTSVPPSHPRPKPSQQQPSSRPSRPPTHPSPSPSPTPSPKPSCLVHNPLTGKCIALPAPRPVTLLVVESMKGRHVTSAH